MSNAQRKRAAEPGEDERAKKRGRPTKDELNSLAPEDSASRVQARQMLHRHPALEYSSQEESSFYDGLIPWPETFEWSDEDKAAVAEKWEQSDIKEASSKLDSTQYLSLFSLFKISLRVYGTTPLVLLSPYMAMRYQQVYFGSHKWIMSRKFCETLSKIMVHPCWGGDINWIALALQWAVICRLDSRRKWYEGLEYSCPVIQQTLDKVQGFEGKFLDTSYHEIHADEMERASERGESLSIYSHILYKIGEAVPKEPARPETDPEYNTLFGRRVLPVTQWDLDVLVKVVNAMEFKPRWNYSVEDALTAWKAEKSGAELPSRDKLPLIYEITYKGIFRFLRLNDREPSAVSRTEESDDYQSPDSSTSGENGSQKDTASPPQRGHRSRQDDFDDSDEEEDESIPANTGLLRNLRHRGIVRGVEEEDDSPVGLDDFSQPEVQDESEDDRMTDNAFGSGEFVPQDAVESPEFRPRGPTLAELLPRGPPASPIYASIREKKMLEELAQLREENKELRDGQKLLQDLFAQGVKKQNEVIAQKDREIVRLLKDQNDLIRKGHDEQKQQMLDIRNEQNKQMRDLMKDMESIKSELTQSRPANEAPNQGDAEQSHPERPSLSEATAIVPGAAPRSPDLGTNLSAPPNDVEVLEETIVVVPMQEDIAPEQPVPKQKTPEPEVPEQPATSTRTQATEPVFGNLNPATGDEDRTQEVSQLPGAIDETSGTHTETKSSEQSSDLPPWPVLPPNPPMPRRNIARLACTGGGRFSARSDARDVFVTPRSEVLKILKGYK